MESIKADNRKVRPLTVEQVEQLRPNTRVILRKWKKYKNKEGIFFTTNEETEFIVRVEDCFNFRSQYNSYFKYCDFEEYGKTWDVSYADGRLNVIAYNAIEYMKENGLCIQEICECLDCTNEELRVFHLIDDDDIR